MIIWAMRVKSSEIYPWNDANLRKYKSDSDVIEILFRYHVDPGMSGDYKMAMELSRQEISMMYWALNKDRTLDDLARELKHVSEREAN